MARAKRSSETKSAPERKTPARKTSGSRKPSSAAAARSSRVRGAADARPAWTGNLKLALVSVPVRIYPATRSGARISFHQVHEPSKKRIRYEKVVPGIGPVDTDEIVKGYDLGKGDYILIDPAELEELKLETKQTLNLVQFVAQGEIDPIWFDRPYYVVADGDNAEEAYGVLRDALRSTKKYGLGQFVMRGREYVAALKPCGNGLLMETLRFSDEVREAAPFFAGIDTEDHDSELLDLAEELIERKSGRFDPQQFKDSYTEAVRELIEAKAKNKPVAVDEGEDESGGGAEVINLVDALKRSVQGNSGRAKTQAKPAAQKSGASKSSTTGTRRKAS